MTFNDKDLCDKTSTSDDSGSDKLVFGRSLFPLMTGDWPTEQEEEMDRHKIPAWVFYPGLLVLFAAGLALMFWGHKNKSDNFIAEILELLGHAIVVAAILAATVDLYVKKLLLKEAASDIAKYLIGYKLPEELQDRIRELMGTTLFRRDVRIHYKMSQSPEKMDKFLIEVEYKFFIENPTNGKLPYIHSISFPIHPAPTVFEMRCDSNDERVSYYLGKDKIKRETVPSVVKFSGKKVQIKSKMRNPNLKYEFSVKFAYERFKNDSDYFAFMEPSIEFTLTAAYPDTIEFVGPETQINRDRWHGDRIFLRGEHVSFRWFEKEEKKEQDQTSLT